MAEDFNIRRFFQRAPREWLIHYFERRGELQQFDWSNVKKVKVDPLVDAFLAIDHQIREEMTQDFLNVALLSKPAGKLAILDEAEHFGQESEVAKILAGFDDFGNCAFWALLERPKLWDGAVLLAAADGRDGRYWRKRINFPRLGRKPTNEEGKRLAAELTKVFLAGEARGTNCVVHQIRRGEKEYYFAYTQDHSRTSIEFDAKGQETKRPHRPAFEIIFVHNDADGTLRVWHDGQADRVKDLQVAFAKAVVGKDIPRESPQDTRVYNLKRFLRPGGIKFQPSEALRIRSIETRRMMVFVGGDDGHKVEIKLGKGTGSEVLERRIRNAIAGYKASEMDVGMVGLCVTFEPSPGSDNPVPRTFEVRLPNICTIKDDEYAPLLERLLEDHEIEAKTAETNPP